MSAFCSEVREVAVVGLLLLVINLASVGFAALIVVSRGF